MMTLADLYPTVLTKAIYQSTETPMHLESSKAKRRVLRYVARIGSQSFQNQACVQGTREKYVLLDELLETTLSSIEHEITSDVLARKWSHLERNALQDFVNRANELFDQIAWQDESLSLAGIVNEDPSMKMIRDAANECLRQVQVNFSMDELLAD